jgi:hypothetical protein
MLDDRKEDTAIATLIVILEPFCNEGNSSQELPVKLNLDTQLIPFKRPIVHSIPPKLHSKPTHGELSWWLIHHTQPSWSGIHVPFLADPVTIIPYADKWTCAHVIG